MILKQCRVDDIKQLKFQNIKQKHYCLVNLTEHEKDKEKWHFCLLRGWASFKNVSLANNSHFKISNINQDKLDKTKTS